MLTHRASAILASLALTACGGGGEQGTGGQTTSTGGHGGGFTVAPHSAPPTAVNLGGPVLTAPKVQPIVYASDPHRADLEGFLAALSKSAYWTETTSEYGVGALTILPTLVRPEPAPASLGDGDINADLGANTTGAAPPWGAADPGTIYLFLMPEGTIVDAGGACCTDYDGYHDEASVGAQKLPYAVICTCPGFDGPSVDAVQQISVAVSHELIEASTDPYVQTDPAWAQTDEQSFAWTLATGGEVADLCELAPDAFVSLPGSPYLVQRSYSNAAASAGKDPCLPAESGPYFGAAPALPDKVSASGVPFAIPGVLVPKGQSKTIDVHLFSIEPAGEPITVTAHDLATSFGGPATLELTLDKPSGQNGDTLRLTVHLLAVDPSLGVDLFVVEAKMGDRVTQWIGAAGTH